MSVAIDPSPTVVDAPGRDESGRRPSPLGPVWILIVAWTVLWALILGRGGFMGSWGIFTHAGRIVLTGGPRGGFHLYFIRPDFQFGPIAALVAAPLSTVPLIVSKLIAGVAMTAAGLWMLHQAATLSRGGSRRAVLATGGLLVMPIWLALSWKAGHLDDVLALLFGLLGALNARRGNPIAAAAFLALSVDSKPWALAFGVALFALPRATWPRSAAAWAGLIAAAWLPFFILEPRTFAAMRFRVPIATESVLRLIGLHGAIPPWERPAQLVLALAIGWIVVRRGDPLGVLLATIASRIVLDPEVAAYYTAGAVLAAFIVDRIRGTRIPVLTVLVVALLWLPSFVDVRDPGWIDAARTLRLGWGVITLVVLARGRSVVLEPSLVMPLEPAHHGADRVVAADRPEDLEGVLGAG